MARGPGKATERKGHLSRSLPREGSVRQGGLCMERRGAWRGFVCSRDADWSSFWILSTTNWHCHGCLSFFGMVESFTQGLRSENLDDLSTSSECLHCHTSARFESHSPLLALSANSCVTLGKLLDFSEAVSSTSIQYTFYRKTNYTTCSLGSLQGIKLMDNCIRHHG